MSSVSKWTTTKIKEILDNPYGCSDIGTDYEQLLPELRDEYYKRMNKLDAKNNDKLIEERDS